MEFNANNSMQAKPRWFLSGQLVQGEASHDIAINQFPFRMGRRTDLSLCVMWPGISKLHAEINQAGETLIVCDLGSRNGTFVNGERVSRPMPLRENDVLQIADCAFRVGRFVGITSSGTIDLGSSEWARALSQFHRLLQGEGVIPHFQPIVRMSDASHVGYELLARSSLAGLDNPSKIFQAAAMLKRECELSEMLRDEGLKAAQVLDHSTEIFVNTHPAELESDRTILSFQRLREAHPQQSITIEIHEAAVTDPKLMGEYAAAIRDLDMKLAYDDFGAGQARLIELIEVPPQFVKFDINLIRKIDTAPEARQSVLATLVKMVRDLGIQTLAEGIESVGEANFCRKIGFDFAQGFQFGRPAPVEMWIPRNEQSFETKPIPSLEQVPNDSVSKERNNIGLRTHAPIA